MQSLRFSLVAMAALFAAVLPAFGQRVPAQPAEAQAKAREIRGEQALLAAEAIEKLKFTTEQKEKYVKIDGEFKEKLKTTQDKIREDMKAIRDREKVKEWQEKLKTEWKKVRDDHLGKIEPILTAEQKTVFTEVKNQQAQPGVRRPAPPLGDGAGQVLPPAIQQRLNLTDDQKKQIANIQKEVEAKILKVLTDDQKKQFEELKKGGARPAVRPTRPIEPSIRGASPPAVDPAAPRKD